MDYLDDLFAEEDEKKAKQELEKALADDAPKDAAQEQQIIEEPQSFCRHVELFKSICQECYKSLSEFEINGRGGEEDVQYREYALLGLGRDIKIRSDCAQEKIQK